MQGGWGRVLSRIRRIDSPFVRNMGWMGATEGVIRVFRLITTVVLARCLSPHDYGAAALVLTVNELIKVFTSIGIGSKLIQADEKDLEDLAQGAYRLGWLVFGGLAVVQCLVAVPIASFYGDSQLFWPLCAIAINLLLIPLSEIQVALIQRENRLRVLALTSMVQVTVDNLLSLTLALAGWGMWAIVLPKVLVGPIWLYSMRKNHPWRPQPGWDRSRWKELLDFGRNVLGVEVLKTLRNNLDYLLIGRFLGLEALGTYYFAFNAGLGLSLGLITSVNTALLPHLCAVRQDLDQLWTRYQQSLKAIAFLIVPVILIQSCLAPFYVPLVFGAKWTAAIPILVIICLSALPRPFADAASKLLLAVNKPQLDLQWNLLFTGIFVASLLVGVQGQSLGVAIAVLVSHGVALPLFTFWAKDQVFGQPRVALP